MERASEAPDEGRRAPAAGERAARAEGAPADPGARRERDSRERRRGAEEPSEGRGGRRGRPPLSGEVTDLNRGAMIAGVESAAIVLDMASRVLRSAIDRAFDEDYSSPGDLVRGLADQADHGAFDVVGELRNVPRRLAHRFDESIRSPRADQGERQRREDAGSTTPADSPSASRG
jgi:hypothetical protein